MDPITAFAAAQAAVTGIKKAVALGKDIQGLIADFSKFFDAKDTVQKAVNDAGKKGKSDTAQALEFVMQAEQLRAQEEELKHLLIYGYGAPDLWNQLLMKRNEIRQERERQELAQKRKRIAKQQMLMDILGYSIIGLGVGGFLAFSVYVVLHAR